LYLIGTLLLLQALFDLHHFFIAGLTQVIFLDHIFLTGRAE